MGEVVGVDTSPHAEATYHGTHLRIRAGLPRRCAAARTSSSSPRPPPATPPSSTPCGRWTTPCPSWSRSRRPTAPKRRSGCWRPVTKSTIFHSGFAPKSSGRRTSTPRRGNGSGTPLPSRPGFTNPYAQDLAGRTASLANSWLDSGINALSIIGRTDPDCGDFVPAARGPRERVRGPLRTGLRRGLARGHDRHNLASSPSKTQSTRLRFYGGAELALDHIAGTVSQRWRLCGGGGGGGTKKKKVERERMKRI